MLPPDDVRIERIPILVLEQRHPLDIIVGRFQTVGCGAISEPLLLIRSHERKFFYGFRLRIFESDPLWRERVKVLQGAGPHPRRPVESIDSGPTVTPLGTLLNPTVGNVVEAMGCQLLIAELEISNDDAARFPRTILLPQGARDDQAILEKTTQTSVWHAVHRPLPGKYGYVLKSMDEVPAILGISIPAES